MRKKTDKTLKKMRKNTATSSAIFDDVDEQPKRQDIAEIFPDTLPPAPTPVSSSGRKTKLSKKSYNSLVELREELIERGFDCKMVTAGLDCDLGRFGIAHGDLYLNNVKVDTKKPLEEQSSGQEPRLA